MYILLHTWFTTLIRQFFFSIDKIVFNFISEIYDLLIVIARTSVLSQADILDMASRIYKLLAVFMIFKVTLSIIGYVVNPDDFSDKTKGVSKLGVNIIISLSLLILTPYIFNLAYRFQTIVLEDNALATVIFGDEVKDGFLNTAGDQMAFTVMAPFYSPNLSIKQLESCINLTERTTMGEKTQSGKEIYTVKVTSDCNTDLVNLFNDSSKVKGADKTDLNNYIVGVNNSNLGLMFRQELATATYNDGNNDTYIMDYKFIFSTVIGVVVCLLLITFCMDIGVRSIKLAFLQLVAPIPIISYVDPKSGKDGLFKKWYQMCFKTYISLFVRLLTIYFAVYIISLVADLKLVDVVDGSYVTNGFVAIFIIIGALMFAKQLPKILEGLGIKLDGDGKFTLNPLKKFEEQAFGGKNITGMARGALVGTAGMLSGAGAGRAFSGAWRGLTSGKGWKETGKAEAEMNRKMRQAKLDGSSFGGRLGAKFAGALGFESASENIEGRIRAIDEQKTDIDNRIKPTQSRIADRKAVADKINSMEERAIKKIQDGEAGILSRQYKAMLAEAERLQRAFDKGEEGVTAEIVAAAQNTAQHYLTNAGRNNYIDITTGRSTKVDLVDAKGTSLGSVEFDSIDEKEKFGDETMKTFDRDLRSMTKTAEVYETEYIDENGNTKTREVKVNADVVSEGTAKLHKLMGELKGSIADDTRTIITPAETEKRTLDEEKADLYESQRRAKADENASK